VNQQAREIAAREASQAANARIQEWEQRQQRSAVAKVWQQREAEFAAKTPDYREVAYDDSVPVTAAMAEMIAESDEGPALAYYLGKNRDEAARIAALGDRAAAREIGRIEARLSVKPVPAVSKAPPPPPKIEASDATVSVRVDRAESDTLSDREWIQRRNKQLARASKPS
jgi:hypothetical protein